MTIRGKLVIYSLDAGRFAAQNSIVLILFCLLPEIGRSQSESESPASVLGCSRLCGADKMLVSEFPQSSGFSSLQVSSGSVIVGAINGEVYRLKNGGASCGFDTPPAGTLSLSETSNCLSSEYWMRA